MMSEFHFLRPEWLMAFIPLVAVFFMQQRALKLKGQWKDIVSPALQPYMLKHQTNQRSASVIKYALVLAAALAIIALAGPSWKKQPSQIFNSQAGLVIALDLSLSMTAQDITPSRLQRAKFKIRDILEQNKGSNIALVAYAGDAHVATPLTRDVKTIQSMLPALDPYIMPAQGSNVRRLVEESIALFDQGKSNPRTLLLISDGVEENDIEYASKALQSANIHLSILAIGTEQGAPLVQPDGRFFKDSSGQVIMPALEWDSLNAFAEKSAGRIQKLTSSDADIKYLTNIKKLEQDYAQTEESVEFDQWFDSGYWFIIPIMLLALVGFRKGVILSCALIMFPYEGSWAENTGIQIPAPLINDNQKAMRSFDTDPANAAQLFSNEKWKASSFYKAKDFENALSLWEKFNDLDSLYNQGNALTQLNRLEEAIKAYDQALKIDPDHEDAAHNKRIAQELLEQQKSQQNSDQDSNQSSDDNSDKNQQGDQNNQDSESSDGENSKEESSQQTDSENNGDPSEAQQNQDSENPMNQDPESQLGKDEENSSAEQQSSETPNKDREENASQTKEASNTQEEDGTEKETKQISTQASQQDSEQEQAMKQWMKRIPDDPGGLLRNKFLYQYKNRNTPEQDGERKPW